MKKYKFTLPALLICAAIPAFAVEQAAQKPAPATAAAASTPAKPSTPQKTLSPEELLKLKKQALQDQIKYWNALSRERKIAKLNEDRTAMMKTLVESWAKMTDDQKIAQKEQILANQKKQLGL